MNPYLNDKQRPEGSVPLLHDPQVFRVLSVERGVVVVDVLDVDLGGGRRHLQGCQMAKFDPFPSLDFARVEGEGAQSMERKGSNFAA